MSNERWPASKATDWYAEQPWLVGCNYIPAYAINPIECWQDEHFNVEAISRELRLAASIGMNSIRVFLHHLCFEADKGAFIARLDQFFDLAAGAGIRSMPVFFDSCWHPFPRPGRQPSGEPRVHNSGWVQCPGVPVLREPAAFERLRPYVFDIISHFRDDRRVVVWDLWNEPDNTNGTAYSGRENMPDKNQRVAPLLAKTFAWARDAKPSQPLTSGIWGSTFDDQLTPGPTQRVQLESSDVISFHTYVLPESAQKGIEHFRRLERPLLCTEFMSRGTGNTFEALLPIFKQHKVGAYCWGLVSGRTQTIYPWDSWQKRYDAEPEPWFHDIFRVDHSPYREDETRFIRQITLG